MDTDERQVEQTLRVADSSPEPKLVEASIESPAEMQTASRTESGAIDSRSNAHQTMMHPSLKFSVHMLRVRFLVTLLPAMGFFVCLIGILTSERLMRTGWLQYILMIFICFAAMAWSTYRLLSAYKQKSWILNHIPSESCNIKIRPKEENRETIVCLPGTTDSPEEVEYYCTSQQDNLSYLFPQQAETVSVLLYRHPLTKAPVAIEAGGKVWLLRPKSTTLLSKVLEFSPWYKT